MIGDYCDKNEECITKFCDQNECREEENMFPNKLIAIAIVIVVSVIVASCLMYIGFKYMLKDDDEFNTHLNQRRTSSDSKKSY